MSVIRDSKNRRYTFIIPIAEGKWWIMMIPIVKVDFVLFFFSASDIHLFFINYRITRMSLDERIIWLWHIYIYLYLYFREKIYQPEEHKGETSVVLLIWYFQLLTWNIEQGYITYRHPWHKNKKMRSFIRTAVPIRMLTGSIIRNARLVFQCWTSDFQLGDFHGFMIWFIMLLLINSYS